MSVAFQINFRKPRKQKRDYSDEDGLFLQGENGSVVLLIHGLTGTPNEMKFLANFWNSKGFTVICPLLANHAQPLDVLKHTRWQELYEQIRQSFLDLNHKYDRVFIAGLSMGALLALLLAEEFPERISAISCLSPTLFYDGWNTPWYQCFLPLVSRTYLKYFFYFKEDPPYGIKNERIRQMVHRYYNGAKLGDMEGVARYGYPYFPVALLYQLQLLVKYLSKKLKGVTTPTQIMQAKDDDVTSVQNSQFVYDRINSRIKEMVLFYDSYHVITADQEREKVASEMERFFKRIQDASGALKNA